MRGNEGIRVRGNEGIVRVRGNEGIVRVRSERK